MNHLKRILSCVILGTTICAFVFMTFEVGPVQAATATDTVVVTLNVTTGISITAPADTTMSQTLGVAASTAVGTTTWNVKTNNVAGYTLAVKASTAPAMQAGGPVISDYQTGAPNTWSATNTSAYFGYSGFGTDIPTGTWGTGSVCSAAGANAISTSLKYKGFTTSDVTIATRSATTTPTGVDSTVCYAVEQGNAYYLASGTYTATITATATTL